MLWIRCGRGELRAFLTACRRILLISSALVLFRDAPYLQQRHRRPFPRAPGSPARLRFGRYEALDLLELTEAICCPAESRGGARR